MSINNRLKELRKALNLTQESFGEIGGLTKGAVSAIETGKSKITIDFLTTLYEKYNISADWVLNGKGRMFALSHDNNRLNQDYTIEKDVPVNVPPNVPLSENPHLISPKTPHLIDNSGDSIPYSYNLEGVGIGLYDDAVFAGTQLAYNEASSAPSSFIHVPGFKGAEAAVRIHGESMQPHFKNGDIVIVKRILSRDSMPWHKIALVVLDSGTYLKYLHKKGAKEVELTSSNPLFAPMQTSIKALTHVYEVMGKITHLYGN